MWHVIAVWSLNHHPSFSRKFGLACATNSSTGMPGKAEAAEALGSDFEDNGLCN